MVRPKNPEPGDDLVRICIRMIELAGHRNDFGVHELTHRAENVPLQVGQTVGLR